MDNEELFIAQQLGDIRAKIDGFKKTRDAVNDSMDMFMAALKAEEKTIAQAALDYMEGNGVKSSEFMYIRKSESVDAPDVEAVPDEYVKIKKEVDKKLVGKTRPVGNWYKIETKKTVQLKEIKI